MSEEKMDLQGGQGVKEIKDFNHLCAMIKACGVIERLRVQMERLSIVDEAEDILQLMVDSTDRKFLPMNAIIKQSALAVISLDLCGVSIGNEKIASILESSINNISEADLSKNITDADEALDVAYAICLMDDCIGWYRNGKWEGPSYSLEVLNKKYRARVLYLQDKEKNGDKIKELLGELSVADVRIENERFYKKNV